MTMGAVDALTGTYRLPCPTRGNGPCAAVLLPRDRAPPGSGASRSSTASCSHVRCGGRARRPGRSRRARLGAAGAGRGRDVRQPDDVAPRRPCDRAHGTRDRPGSAGRVALVLLLPARGHSRARSRRRPSGCSRRGSTDRRRRRALPGRADRPRSTSSPSRTSMSRSIPTRSSGSPLAPSRTRRCARSMHSSAELGAVVVRRAAAGALMGEAPFTPGRDRPGTGRRPIFESMGSAVESTPADANARDLHLLRDCLALGKPNRRRAPAKVRLEEALGPELTHKLLARLSGERS